MDKCRVTIINKSMEYQCNFCVVPGNGTALLGIPDCECLQLLNINCQATNNPHKRGLINEKPKQGRSKPKNSIKINLCTYNKTNHEIRLLHCRPRQRCQQRQVQKHQKCMKNTAKYLQELDVSKALSPSMLRLMESHTRCHVAHSTCPPGTT